MMEPHTSTDFEASKLELGKPIAFPEGLPAFEQVRSFRLLSNEEEAPFLWLEAIDQPGLAFITIDPFLIYPSYRPNVPDHEAALLQLKQPEDACLLSIVTIRNSEPGAITANLVSPIVINTREQIGKQVILNNHLEYSVKWQIDVPEEGES